MVAALYGLPVSPTCPPAKPDDVDLRPELQFSPREAGSSRRSDLSQRVIRPAVITIFKECPYKDEVNFADFV